MSALASATAAASTRTARWRSNNRQGAPPARHCGAELRTCAKGMPMTIRVAAIEVSHWHAVYDAAYLRQLVAMPDVELVAIQDSDAALVAKRASQVTSPSPAERKDD